MPFGQGRKLQKFPRIYNFTDFTMTADVAAQPSQWNTLGSVTVPAQQEITFGANDPTGGSGVSGRSCYLILGTSGGSLIEGKVRFALTNANETNTVVVAEERTEKLRADQNDRTKAVLLPEYPMRSGEDSKLKILFYPDSATAVTVDYDGTQTDALIPVTVYQ